MDVLVLCMQAIYLRGRGVLTVHVGVHVLCRSFNYTYEECWGSTLMYFCAGRSNIPARFCWGSSSMYSCCAGRSTTRTRCTDGPCGCTCVVQVIQLHGRGVLRAHVAVHMLCRSFNYTDEMYSEPMWLYMVCAGHSTTRTRCTQNPCG